ncbi:serine hydrolase domain-containing protein [Algoriphagus sediminis]|uniref:Serine hydrolase domain-containing protein n=1 Tax=Algoriphagus sediminis TaxID=3057113 RepID=A0ABT7YCQ7_9BACT|nr:serine hydrolase domain-containing protein [Algoriphagus sediminis]MDN3204310.1 serine hydrolase domain-containing protein [Algoriphagus sediminis]
MKNKLPLIIVFLIIGFGCTQNTPKEQTAVKTQKQVEKVDKSNSELKAVSIYKDGLSAKQAQEYRNKYRSSSFITADNAGAYGFLNLTEVANTGTIYRDGQVALLEEEINLDILETMTYTNAGDKTFRELLNDEQARMQGVLIIHGGKIVFEKYMGMRRLDKHVWFSASKSLTGLLVHILEEEGLIDLNKNVTHYIPEFSSEDWQKVKVEHLLHHVSGMDYVETNKNFKTPGHPLAVGFAYAIATRSEPSEKSLFDIMKDVKLYIEPGIQFDYSTMNTQILGIIVERVTNKKFEDVLSDKIWTKVGMESEGHYAITPQGEVLNGAIFSSRLRDMGRFGMLFTPSWNKVSDKQIVSDSYFKKAYDKKYSDAYLKGEQGSNNAKYFNEIPSHASYQWDCVFDDGDMYKAGRYGQGIYVSPKTNTVIVWFSSVYENLLYFPGFSRQIIKEHYRK